ncbi:hypothetical protein GWK26_08655 [haloarchaeon 3A1-DGR]|nr:hypothetical protein GWK26_08655 [haloarchaeon 3A1-DGR]
MVADDPDIFIAPCSREHKQTTIRYFRDTVLEGVSPEEYPELRDLGFEEPISVWGVMSSKRTTWEQMSPGDVVLFYTKSGEYTHSATVDSLHSDEALARRIWEPYDEGRTVEDIDDPWLHMFFLRDVKEVNIPADVLHSGLGYSMEYPLGFMRPSDDAHAQLRREYGSVHSFLSEFEDETTSTAVASSSTTNGDSADSDKNETVPSTLLDAPVYKFSGRIEHWVTTFHQGFWGLPAEHEAKWNRISAGDTFLFHATKPEYIDDSDAGGGVIGIGTVGGFDTKDEKIWLEEQQGGRRYPYLIYFDELYWFGDTADIRDVPISDKPEAEVIEDCYSLSENILSFKEMRDETGYSFNPMGVMSEVKEIQKLRPLLYGRLRGIESETRTTPTPEHDSETEAGFTTSRRRDRAGAENLNVTDRTDTVKYERDTGDIQQKTKTHEKLLDVFETKLSESGFDVSETTHSDMIAIRDDTAILGEAKVIHDDNESDRIRTALGQLLEYRYHDFRRRDSLGDDPLLFLIFSQSPSKYYAAFLEDLQDDGVYTFWIDDETIKGLPESGTVYRELL